MKNPQAILEILKKIHLGGDVAVEGVSGGEGEA